MYREVLEIIQHAGYECYLVGGSVRDMLMGVKTGDYDICTSAHPEEIKSLFKDHTVIETGIKHGTVTVVYKHTPFEITVFRSESDYSDHRHPDKVIFGAKLEDDLMRRDFTMNAICFDGVVLVDPLNGQRDIQNRVIRAVGAPEKRFEEDVLRILRALRFASVLGFTIEAETEKAMRKTDYDFKSISNERIFSEFSKAAKGKYFEQVYIEYYEVFAMFIPNAVRKKTVFANASEAVSALKALKADKKSIRLAEIYFTAPEFANPIILLRKYGYENAKFLCEKRGMLAELDKVMKSNIPYSVSMLDIDGNDISELTNEKTKIGAILEKLLDSVIDGEIQNKREILLQKAVDIL